MVYSIVLVALAALSSAAPASISKHVLHEVRPRLASDWVKSARVESSAILPMRIGLTQNNLEKGYDYLMDVSHPDSANYGKYWDADQVHDAFKPSEDTVQSVKDWLISAGIDSSRIVHSDNKGWLAFDATAQEAENLLLAEYYEHEHVRSEGLRVGCDAYHLPEHLVSHIDYVLPGVKMSPVVKRDIVVKRDKKPHDHDKKPHDHDKKPHDHEHPRRPEPPNGDWHHIPGHGHHLPPDLQGCGTNMTVTCIRAMYGIPQLENAAPGNSLGLYQQGSYFSEDDVNKYFAQYAPWVPQNTFPIPQLIDGARFAVPSNSSLDSGESDIDIDMTTSLIYPQSVVLYQTDDQLYEPAEVATTNLFNTFLDALDGSYCTYSAFGETGNDPAIDPDYPDPRPGGYKGQLQCGVYKPTNVISASYGQAEADLPPNYTKRQCNEFMKLGLQGHSILFAAGDYGVASFPGDGSADGCLGPDGLIMNPQYPSNCPYVTSVGGTQIYADQIYSDPESVMHVDLGGSAVNFSSAGGFSNYFPRPDYQKSAVERFFEIAQPSYPYYSEMEVDVNTTKGIYNRIGRAYPDVAANGANFRAYTNGHDYFWYGSSLAAPLFASVITLLNEERFARGKGPIGFINPTLYAHPEVLNDITNGTNVGCGTEGFPAVEGWDPATGLGTPNYKKMRQLFVHRLP